MTNAEALDHAESRRRLLVLADFLDALPPRRFDYSSWVGMDWKGLPDLSCGTTACALGWATAIPEFQALGLRLVKTDLSHSFSRVMLGDYNTNSSAAAIVFGITSDEADYLFLPGELPPYERRSGKLEESPDAEASAKDVAQHIRDFVAETRPEVPVE